MIVTFNGEEIFSGAVVRVREGAWGTQLVERSSISPELGGQQSAGPLNREVILSGRLRGADLAGLQLSLANVATMLAGELAVGPLVVGGREWNDLSFVSLKLGDRIDLGRECSVGFTARFVGLS